MPVHYECPWAFIMAPLTFGAKSFMEWYATLWSLGKHFPANSWEATACLNKFRIRVGGVQGNQGTEGLRIPNPDFQPILLRAKFYSIAT